MSLSSETTKWVCAQVKEIESKIRDAEALLARLKLIGEPVGTLEAQLSELKARYERLVKAFPECL